MAALPPPATALAVVLALVAVPSQPILRNERPGPVPRETVLYSFAIGATPSTGLVSGKDGVLFGMGSGGEGYGTVYRAAPSGGGDRWNVRVINDFTDADGAGPVANLMVGAAGALYGTTVMGGTGCSGYYCGVAFKLTPPPPHQYFWNETVLHNFTEAHNDGVGPYSTLVSDAQGALYGTTSSGGSKYHPAGTVFRLAPRPHRSGWTEEVVYAFKVGGSDGTSPYAGVVIGANGALYGTTVSATGGCGAVYSVAPPQPPSHKWAETVLYTFAAEGSGDACAPRVGLVLAADGTLYGTTGGGGSADMGAVYAVSPPSGSASQWTERVVHSFTGPDGEYPGQLTIGADGALYGTCYQGGNANDGVVFELVPPRRGHSDWSERVLQDFAGADGANPATGVLRRADGALFGTTPKGGANGAGTIFEVKP